MNEKPSALRCHNGPMFTNNGFHNIATGQDTGGITDFGRMIGLEAARLDEFNCLGKFSDEATPGCTHLKYAKAGHETHGAFKVPSLRNVQETGPYMHDGRFESLPEVLRFYSRTPDPRITGNEIRNLRLTAEEVADLTAFLGTLSDLP